MIRREFRYSFIFMIFFLMVLLGLNSSESKEFDDFFDTQKEREIEKIQEEEAVIKRVSEKYILTFFYIGNQEVSNFYLGNQEASNEAARYVLNLALKYNWLTYAISLDGIFIDGFENNKINNGIFEEFQNRTYKNVKGPSLFLFNPQNNNVHWITSWSSEFKELEHLIYTRDLYFGL